jgi:uncharacterized protein
MMTNPNRMTNAHRATIAARKSFPNAKAAFALAFALLFAATPIEAQQASQLAAPDMNGPVNDLANVMSAAERSELTDYLVAVNNQTGVQVAVLTVPSLEGDSIEAFSMRVAEKWKLGQADKDNGALLVIALAERSLRIEVGYGLEGDLTDVKSGLIIRNVIVPYFKSGDYGRGIIAGAKNIVGIATNDASIVSENVRKPDSESGSGAGVAGIIFLIIFIMIISGAARGRNRRHGGGMGGIIWPLIVGSMLSNSGRNHHHSSWGGGGFGGGGGGFSGGGGGFGGGGASGGW